MKKLMTAMLGLSMLMGATSVFAADKDTSKSTATKSTTKKAKKASKKSKTATTSTAPAAK